MNHAKQTKIRHTQRMTKNEQANKQTNKNEQINNKNTKNVPLVDALR